MSHAKAEVLYHIPRMIARVLLGGALFMLVGAGLMHVYPLAMASFRPASYYLNAKINVDPDTHCVTFVRDTPHHLNGMQVAWVTELVSASDTSREYCGGSGTSLFQKKPDNTVRMQLSTWVKSRICEVPIGVPVITKLSARFTVAGVQKTLLSESDVFVLSERKGGCWVDAPE